MTLRERVEAIHQGDVGCLTGRADSPDEDLLAVARRITRDLSATRRHLETRLRAAAIPFEAGHTVAIATRHELVFDVPDAAAAEAGAALLADDGYDRWDPWTRGAARSFHRHGDRVTVARTDDRTTVVRFRWARESSRSPQQRMWKPTTGDWALIDLPTWASRAYPLVRMSRLVAERLGIRPRHAESLGPFLATPTSLLEPLLDFAAAGEADTVLDLGCGDGRLPVAAASRGSRAMGIDRDHELVERARERARDAGVIDRVRLEVGDARTVDVGDADVVFAFLPSDVLADLLPTVLPALRPGARVIAHEQTRLPDRCVRPDETKVLLGDRAITVAHRWTATPDGRSGTGPRPTP